MPTIPPPPSTFSILPSMAPTAFQHGDPCTLVIFGAAGDLSRRKLLPAIYLLARQGLLAADFTIIGVGIEALDDDKLRTMMREALGKSEEIKGGIDEAVWKGLADKMHWVGGDLTKGDVYGTLDHKLGEIEASLPRDRQNRLFYLSVPPGIFGTIVSQLASTGIAPRQKKKASPWRRVICEKPFGTSLVTAKKLGDALLGAVDEHQIYRIDHYVGKETVQNVLVARSANAIFEALWNRAHISHVQITAAETVGLEGRGGYYEHSGVIRDMFQNHLLQTLALTAMEPPAEPTADATRDEKVKVLRKVRPLVRNGETSAVRAQYTAGIVKGEKVVGYREEQGASPTSVTPTYAGLRVEIDSNRWRGVPFFLRSGKRMARRVSEIAIVFTVPERLMYEPVPTEILEPNVLSLRLQPDDGMSLRFTVKVPGAAMALTPGIEITPVDMRFEYASVFGPDSHPAYATLLLDCMIGDATLFTRTDEVEAAWEIIDPLLEHWEQSKEKDIPTYEAGTWGPSESDELLAKDGYNWRQP